MASQIFTNSEGTEESGDEQEALPLIWLNKKRMLKKRYGYLDQELKRSTAVNQPINVVFDIPFDSNCYGINCIQFSPLGQTIAAGCANGDIQVQ